MGRYDNRIILDNRSSLYKTLFDGRGIKNITHFNTPKFKTLTDKEVEELTLLSRIWTNSDTFYKLSYEYYGNINYWWIIGLFNEAPTEYHLIPGQTVWIPFPLEKVISFYSKD